MKQTPRMILCLVIAMIMFVVYVWNFGLWPRFFDIAWDEEVQLHDGRVIVVHFKRTYQRKGMCLSRYENATAKQNEMIFENASPNDKLVFRSRMAITVLDQVKGKWYVVVNGQGLNGKNPDEMPDRWGPDFATSEDSLAGLKDGVFRQINWDLAPPEINRVNLFPSLSSQVLAKFVDKKITLEDKRKFEQSNPAPGGWNVRRPPLVQ